ncbi:uncharacterized protein PV09_08595 [Verruconis gallopava]|uniref:Uncharacterized protein n=1 Tax=Verruconis gallopava TaxID=253628 RepID=A0A0D2A0D8_9PEZI|nr:uncharacterized protein PV09_08595 [Verruconis gallopava]KIV99789.1 hypothetical protein PV09_08595 [Verruconis gallopava]
MAQPSSGIPRSYATLRFNDISIEHYPKESVEVTPIVVVYLDRPQKMNAFTDYTREELELVYGWFDKDARVRCVVLTGRGKAFCAGFDLEVGFPGARDASGRTKNVIKEREVDHRDSGGRTVLAIHRCSKPTICAINGAAVGVGITMTLPSVIRVAYEKAKVGFVFTQRGLVMEACSSFFLPRLIGHSKALYLTSTGAVYPANSPHFGHLFNELLPTPEATVARALELADAIVKNTSIVSNKMCRDLMYRGPDSAEATHLLDSKIIHGLYGKKDNLEGIESFLEKRAPRFSGNVPEDAPDSYPWFSTVDIGSPSKIDRPPSKL